MDAGTKDMEFEIFNRLLMLGERPGWHHQDGVGIHVARSARSYRLPKPLDPTVYCMRSTFARFDEPSGHSEWRELERDVDTKALQSSRTDCGGRLVRLSPFSGSLDHHPLSQQKKGQL